MPRCVPLVVMILAGLAGPCSKASAADLIPATARDTAPAVHDIPANGESADLTVPLAGLILAATAPATMSGAIHFAAAGFSGVECTIINHSLRAVTQDDWRPTQPIAGHRHDAVIDFPLPAFGTPAERRQWGIDGNDGDWDNFSMQWDGIIHVPVDGVDFATVSDDGSRMWIDRKGDGVVSPPGWGSNGWGSGHGSTEMVVQTAVPAGNYRFRIQYEEGGGGNNMTLHWKLPGAAVCTVPASAFEERGTLTVSGPVTLAGTIAGVGVVKLLAGASLRVAPAVDEVVIAGRVTVGADLDLRRVRVRIDDGGALDLAGHHVKMGATGAAVASAGNQAPGPATTSATGAMGTGIIILGGGILDLADGEGAKSLAIRGPGQLDIGGVAQARSVDPAVTVGAGTLRAGDRCVVHGILATPLTTVALLAEGSNATGALTVSADLDLAADAPENIGVGAWRADRQGRWFQCVAPGRIGPGHHHLDFDLGGDQDLVAEGHRGTWNAAAAMETDHLGLFFFSEGTAIRAGAADMVSSDATAATAATSAAVNTILTPSATVAFTVDARIGHPAAATVALTPLPSDPTASSPDPGATAAATAGTDATAATTTGILADLHLDPAQAATGKRWSLTVRPVPYPADPYDPDDFALDLEIDRPDGSTVTIAGFHDEPVERHDRGDIETFTAAGPPRFCVRYRPQMPGVHHLRLTARWRGGPPLEVDLPDLDASGDTWDGIVRVDKLDPRFFSAGGHFVWPAGCSLNSTYDTRCRGAMGTILTPDRGSFVRDAFLDRLAAGGGTGCEVWLSPWNLGLEWSTDWPGFRGAGRYNPGHAWAFDRFLDRAEALGIHVNVSIFNHGMARNGTSAEDDWHRHPYAVESGGWLSNPTGLFNDDRAFTMEKRLFRYLAARYGDSPALLGWKLWAEVNLVSVPGDKVEDWHRRASAALSAADPWHHPITSHWCGDWHGVDPTIAKMPTINYLTIDAYKGDETAIAGLLAASTGAPDRPGEGLGQFHKPVLVTEFGGGAGGTSRERMAAEHAVGPWAALVTGHAGSPMLWWFEWIDQQNRFGVYGAINRFIVGEDLRGRQAHAVTPATLSPVLLWSRAWVKPGRALGYALDRDWGNGRPDQPITGAVITVPELAAGNLHVEWWDADLGTIVGHDDILHPDAGPAELRPPTFRRHLAFKIMKVGE